MRKLLLLIVVSFSILKVQATEPDTTTCKKIVQDFYNWYSGKIITDNQSEYQPKFAQDKNGYVTLDFSGYVQNLKRFKFTDRLIKQEIDNYKTCTDNLKKIKYSDFETKLSDLSDFEKIECAFFNTNRWTKTMENFTGVELSKSTIKKDKVFIFGRIFERTPVETYYYGNVIITLVKINNQWMIDEIEI